MSARTRPRQYRQKQGGAVVTVSDYHSAVVDGRFTCVYHVEWPDGRVEDVPAMEFHRKFERLEVEP